MSQAEVATRLDLVTGKSGKPRKRYISLGKKPATPCPR